MPAPKEEVALMRAKHPLRLRLRVLLDVAPRQARRLMAVDEHLAGDVMRVCARVAGGKLRRVGKGGGERGPGGEGSRGERGKRDNSGARVLVERGGAVPLEGVGERLEGFRLGRVRSPKSEVRGRSQRS